MDENGRVWRIQTQEKGSRRRHACRSTPVGVQSTPCMQTLGWKTTVSVGRRNLGGTCTSKAVSECFRDGYLFASMKRVHYFVTCSEASKGLTVHLPSITVFKILELACQQVFNVKKNHNKKKNPKPDTHKKPNPIQSKSVSRTAR